MTVRDTQRAITPGSTESGDRAGLEQGISQVLSGAGPSGDSAPGGVAAPAPVPTPEDPLGALLSGAISGNPDLPSSDGLSVGPGAGAPQQIAPVMQTDRADLLRDLAQNAETPALRQASRNELRRMLREAI